MKTTILRDNMGKKLGEIVAQSDGILIARDVMGRKKGAYYPSDNSTRDNMGKKLGEGNMLSALILSNLG